MRLAMTDLKASPLGQRTRYAEHYDRALLFPVERAPQRAELGFGGALPFSGVDVWNAYELMWLDAAGHPQLAIATFGVPAESPRLVESKSVKLYLTSFGHTRIGSESDVAAILASDLSDATGSPVSVALTLPQRFAALRHAELAGDCLDALPVVADDTDALRPDALSAAGPRVGETLMTRLFRSVCPVTGQPDFACVQIAYRGARIDRAGLLRYLVSYRHHPGFHEHCVERIFADLWHRCAPESLSVHARFTRRGGIDINPWRTSDGAAPPAAARTARQ
jgi:7-cyano-7-deazaguanine reductase